jgi:UDP-GlcNAc:undecaprenyl-phosphate GlcNAc-1-phosphate transferase
MSATILVGVFLAAAVAAIALTPLVRAISHCFDFVDRPDSHRKIHKTPTALGGGLAVLSAVCCAMLSVAALSGTAREALAHYGKQFTGIGAGVAFICAVGLLDDAFRIAARYKLLGQIIAAGIVAQAGLGFEQISFAGFTIELGMFAVPVTIFWLVACVNAVNLLDGSDGLAAVVGMALSLTVVATAITVGSWVTALCAGALAGSLLGFLRYNAPPATIFLGDAGSMAIGLLAGSLTIQGNVKGAATYAMLAPLAMWVIPLMDVGMAVVRRKLTGRSLSATDRSHLHHCLLDRGLTPRQLVVFVGSLCFFSGIGSWLTIRFSNSWFAILSSLAVVGFLVERRIFGHVEFQLAGHRLARLGRQFWSRGTTDNDAAWQSQVRMQGVRPWEELWAFLVDAAHELQVSQLTLDLNLPWLHEGYHASWMRPTKTSKNDVVRLTWPLTSGGRNMGTLSIVSDCDGDHIAWIEKMAEFLAEINGRLPDIAVRENDAASQAPSSATLRFDPANLVLRDSAEARC